MQSKLTFPPVTADLQFELTRVPNDLRRYALVLCTRCRQVAREVGAQLIFKVVLNFRLEGDRHRKSLREHRTAQKRT